MSRTRLIGLVVKISKITIQKCVFPNSTCLHPNVISKRVKPGHPASSQLKEFLQSFKIVMDVAFVFFIAWMWNTDNQIVRFFGLMTNDFTQEKFLLSSFPSTFPKAHILASRLKSQTLGPNPSLETQIPTSRLITQPQGPNTSLETQIPTSKLKIPALRLRSQPQGSNPSLNAQIPTLRLKSQPLGSNPSARL